MNQTIEKALQFKSNPRKISGTQQEQLTNHLQKFGDLGGVVYCRNNKAYVGGNQRSKIFDGSSIEIITRFDIPQSDKTTAYGFINWKGNKYLYREVQFTEQEFRDACIVANNDGGEWDTNILQSEWNKLELETLGFNTSDFDGLFPTEDELSIANDNYEATTSLDYMKFGGYKIQLSDTELAGLNQMANDYFTINGTLLGFAQILITHA